MDRPPDDSTIPWYGLPFVGLWRLASAVERRIGIVRSLLSGLALMLLGVVFCMTFVGILIGIPTGLFGLALVLRALI